MPITLPPSRPAGTVRVISSKSYAHRILLCAALAQGETLVKINGYSEDVTATVNCLKTMGCVINKNAEGLSVTPSPASAAANITINCNESGTLARFILPIAARLYENYTVTGEGSLLTRPFAPLCDNLAKAGCVFSSGKLPISGSGKLRAGKFHIAGDISSQFISGLLLAAPLLDGDSEIILISPLQSSAYVDMTVQVQKQFGVDISPLYDAPSGTGSGQNSQGFYIRGGQQYQSPGEITVEGDWSNGAFFLCMNALGADIRVEGLSPDSIQGDKAVTDILNEFKTKSDVQIDAAQIPDLIPVLSVVAAATPGTTRVYNAERLRIKESDRLQTTLDMLLSLGADAAVTPDGLLIHGKPKLNGGTVNGANDHRIVMAAATSVCACENPVTILGHEAVNKSYPHFFEEWEKLCRPLSVTN